MEVPITPLDFPSHGTGLDDIDPALAAALRARREAPKVDRLTPGEQAAIAAQKTAAAEARAGRLIKTALKRQLRNQIKKLKEAMDPRAMLALKAPVYRGEPVHAGFDAEWVTLTDGAGELVNQILSIQIVIRCGDRTCRYMHVPAGPRRQDRPTMAAFFQKAIREALKEGVLRSMPDEIVVFGHFMRGDLATFLDFWAHKQEFRGLGKTIVSSRLGHAVEVDDPEALDREPSDNEPAVDAETAPDRRPWSGVHPAALRGLDGRRFRVRLRFVDTICLTPGRRGLAYAAQMVGMKKLDLHADLCVPATEAPERDDLIGVPPPPQYGKSRMDLVMRDFRDAFDRYAFADAEIALAYGLMMLRFAEEELGLKRLPGTIAGCAAALFQLLSGGADAVAELVGRTTRTDEIFNERTRNFRRRKVTARSPALDIHYQFARRCYHGGRNEAFVHGPTKVGTFYDFDLPGAYTTALVAMRLIAYDRIRQVLDPAEFGVGDMGFAWITFEFPPDTRFPCLPVRGDGGALFFPLRGRREDEVFVTAPEIHLALALGATITIVQGIVAPWKSDVRTFEQVIRKVQQARRDNPRSTRRAWNELWKELGNSLYGLTAQGLRDKRVFDPQQMASQPVPESPLTDPFVAAWTTGFIRAVLGEILAGVPEDATVVCAVTDGLLVDAPLERLRLDGPLCTHFADLRGRLFDDRAVLEPKHAVRQPISVAVRSVYTALPAPGFDLVCAKGGVKPEPGLSAVRENRYMRHLYLEQFYGMTVEHEQLISAREQLTREADLVGIKRVRRLQLNYDFKRRPIDPRMGRVGLREERIAFDTRPWLDLTEAAFARNRVDAWSKGRERVFKTMADYRDWEAYHAAARAASEACSAAGCGIVQIRGDNAWGVLARAFVQAGRRDRWGVKFEPRGMARVAAALTEAGFPVGKEDITYAGRRSAPVIPHVVALVPETVALLRTILRLYPTFDYHEAFRAEDIARLEAALEAEELFEPYW